MPRVLNNDGTAIRFIICFLSVVVGCSLVGFIAYSIVIIVNKPKAPDLEIIYASLEKLAYDQHGHLSIQIRLDMSARNDNKVVARFTYMDFLVRFADIGIEKLQAPKFMVAKHSTIGLKYIIRNSNITLHDKAMAVMDKGIKEAKVSFGINGFANVKWRLSIFGFLQSKVYISCTLEFAWPTGIKIGAPCTWHS